MFLKQLRRSRWRLVWVIAFPPFLVWIYWDLSLCYGPFTTSDIDHGPDQFHNPPLILLWTTAFFKSGLSAWGVSNRTLTSCPLKCEFTADKTRFKASSAVVYHGYPELFSLLQGSQYMYPIPRPLTRNPNQVWVYQMLEPPSPHYPVYEGLGDNSDFNWTMTYRRDSDVYFPYGDFEVIPGSEVRQRWEPQPKTGLVAGMISECGRESGRDDYIRALHKHLQVDLYGACGHMTCPRSRNCYKELGRAYKFWLSFENSICADYVSEKFYLPLVYGAVPIFYGHPEALNLDRAPKGSFIHTKDFQSPAALAAYLKYLDSHPEEYAKYFEWRTAYRVRLKSSESVAWCDLCTKLHGRGQLGDKSYRSIPDWFLRNNTEASVCLPPYL